MPGEDPAEAIRVVFDELPDLPHLPELPSRGPGSDLIGRSAALLADLHVELQPSGWRLVARPGIDVRRARDLLRRDLDALEQFAGTYAGPLKVQIAGPWTLAAGVEVPRGDRALGDAGATRDVIASLAEGTRRHIADIAARVPAAQVLVQLDEPSLPGVRDGRLPTASGFGAIAAVPVPDLGAGLDAVVAEAGVTAGVHCCADDPAADVLRATRVSFVSVPLDRLSSRRDYDRLGEMVERGVVLLLGVVPGTDTDLHRESVSAAAAPVRSLGHALGIRPEELAQRVVLTPSCGLAGASRGYAVAALARLREVARSLADDAA